MLINKTSQKMSNKSSQNFSVLLVLNTHKSVQNQSTRRYNKKNRQTQIMKVQ